MAERRMFAKTIIDSDAFLDMPLSTQALYFHLSMRGDDEGFVNNPKKIARMLGSGDDELKVLVAKKFIILFDSGVIVIKHWKLHNYIRGDRLKDTNYLDERDMLITNENGSYTLINDNVRHLSDTCQSNVSIGKDRIGKDRLVEDSIKEDKIVTQKSSDDSIRLANYLLQHIHRVNPTFKQPNIKRWAKDIDDAMRIDKRTVEELKNCIEWLYTDKGSFWRKNILSGKKLRDKFDAMNMQVISTKNNQQGKVDIEDIYSKGLTATEVIEEMIRREKEQ